MSPWQLSVLKIYRSWSMPFAVPLLLLSISVLSVLYWNILTQRLQVYEYQWSTKPVCAKFERRKYQKLVYPDAWKADEYYPQVRDLWIDFFARYEVATGIHYDVASAYDDWIGIFTWLTMKYALSDALVLTENDILGTVFPLINKMSLIYLSRWHTSACPRVRELGSGGVEWSVQCRKQYDTGQGTSGLFNSHGRPQFQSGPECLGCEWSESSPGCWSEITWDRSTIFCGGLDKDEDSLTVIFFFLGVIYIHIYSSFLTSRFETVPSCEARQNEGNSNLGPNGESPESEKISYLWIFPARDNAAL